jgi:uncharacterized membrane protein
MLWWLAMFKKIRLFAMPVFLIFIVPFHLPVCINKFVLYAVTQQYPCMCMGIISAAFAASILCPAAMVLNVMHPYRRQIMRVGISFKILIGAFAALLWTKCPS